MRLPDPRRSRVVLVGAGRFDDPDLADLPGVEDNLAGLADLFTDPRLGGFAAQHVQTLLDPTAPHQTGAAVTAAAEEATGLLLVYLAGRILLGQTGEPQLGLAGLGLRRHGGTLPLRLVRAAMTTSTAAAKVLIIDSLLHSPDGDTDAVDDVLLRRCSTEGSGSVLLHRSDTVAGYATPGRPGTTFTRALLDVLLHPAPQPLPLREVAYQISGLLEPATAAGVYRARHTVRLGTYLNEQNPAPPLAHPAPAGAPPSHADLQLLGSLRAAAAQAEHEYHRPDVALQRYGRLVQVSQRVLGLQDPDTARARRRLAHWSGMAGRSDDAVDLLRELFDEQTRLLGPADDRTRDTGHDLAYWSQQ
jgi:hypothetical protein